MKRCAPFLARRVPDLSLDDLVVDADAASGELDADGGSGFEAELVSREAREQIGLPHAGVADQHHLEEIVVVFIPSICHAPRESLELELELEFGLGLGIGMEREGGREGGRPKDEAASSVFRQSSPWTWSIQTTRSFRPGQHSIVYAKMKQTFYELCLSFWEAYMYIICTQVMRMYKKNI